MKTKAISGAVIALAFAGALTACDENSWNNKLDGFEEMENEAVTNQQTIEYTLTEADYKAIASNSQNVALAGADNKAALAAVGTAQAFSEAIPAADYVPAFLASTSFPYFTLTDGSSVRLTYDLVGAVPADVAEASAPQLYTVSAADYERTVWESDDYVAAFAPSKLPADYLPLILADNVEPEAGAYVVVNYQMALQEPDFGGPAPVEPVEVFNNTLTDESQYGLFTVENKTLPEGLDYIWSWGGANYGAKASGYAAGTNYDAEAWLISPEIDLSAFGAATLSYEQATNFFSSTEVLPDQAAAYVREAGGEWVKLSPEYPESMSWTFVPSGDIDLSAFAGKKIQIGFCYISTEAKAGTWEVKNVKIMATPAAGQAMAVMSVPTESLNAVYYHNGSKWTVPAGFTVLNPATYTEMGQKYANLPAAEPYLSTYLNLNFPYASEGDVRNVLWLHYSGGATAYECTQYVHNGSAWAQNNFRTTETNQFVKTGGKWMYDPNVTITLPAGKGVEISSRYYQACVDWVFSNICKPLGDTDIKSGKFYISSYGNNEYYSGTSAYQGNVDHRPSAARDQYPAEYSSMTDDEIVALERTRFMNEVMPGALSILHSDARPIEGLDVLYTINFAVYTGSTSQYTAVFKVVGPGKFEPVSCTWDEE